MIDEICNKLGINPNDIVLKTRKNSNLSRNYSWYELIEFIIRHGSYTAVANHLGVSYKPIYTAMRKLNIPKLNGGNENYRYVILQLIGKKLCNQCNTIKNIADFCSDVTSKSGINSYCKSCASVKYSKWYAAHREEQIQRVIKRRRNLDRSLTVAEVNIIFDRDNYSCQSCGLSNEDHLINWGTRLHIDHIHPISKGGLTTVENSQLLCVSCNSSKSNKILGT